jgi:hypothetical protein
MLMFRDATGRVAELFGLLWARRLWWLVPAVVVLIFYSLIVALVGVRGVGP